MKQKFKIILPAILVILFIIGCFSSRAERDPSSKGTVPDKLFPSIESPIEPADDTGNAEDVQDVSAVPDISASIPPEGSTFQIQFIDVGQADAALISCDDHHMLIDGGNREDSSRIYSVLQKNSIDHLDIVVGSHAHEDHIGGLPGAYQAVSVDLTLSPVTEYDSKVFKTFKSKAEEQGSGLIVPSIGSTYTLGAAVVQILGLNGGEDTNDTSIILKVTYGDTSFLFTGDAEYDAEHAVLDSGADLSATVLKVGHHGSDTSTCYPFLLAVSPQYAVISVGAGNSYGHPDDGTLSKLRDAGVEVFRTDLQGDIFCTSDGKTVHFETQKQPNVPSWPKRSLPPTRPFPGTRRFLVKQMSACGGQQDERKNMNIYLVGIETSYDYRTFPWLKKTRGSFSLKANMQTIVAETPVEAERKYREARANKMVSWPAMQKLTMEGMWPIMCKEPNQKSQLWIRELDKNSPLGEYLEYMTPEDITLLKETTAKES